MRSQCGPAPETISAVNGSRAILLGCSGGHVICLYISKFSEIVVTSIPSVLGKMFATKYHRCFHHHWTADFRKAFYSLPVLVASLAHPAQNHTDVDWCVFFMVAVVHRLPLQMRESITWVDTSKFQRKRQRSGDRVHKAERCALSSFERFM